MRLNAPASLVKIKQNNMVKANVKTHTMNDNFDKM